MLMYLVPCNALANGNYVAEDHCIIYLHDLLGAEYSERVGGGRTNRNQYETIWGAWIPDTYANDVIASVG